GRARTSSEAYRPRTGAGWIKVAGAAWSDTAGVMRRAGPPAQRRHRRVRRTGGLAGWQRPQEASALALRDRVAARRARPERGGTRWTRGRSAGSRASTRQLAGRERRCRSQRSLPAAGCPRKVRAGYARIASTEYLVLIAL